LWDGFVTPVTSSASGDLPEREMPALHLMALYAFDKVLQLHRPQPQQQPYLTPREREVLTLVALGKSTWKIREADEVRAIGE
jgi:LuxR family quorum sensing-dependent transcriptional regulator